MPEPSPLHSTAAATAPARRRHWPIAHWLLRRRAGVITTLLGLALLPFAGLAFYNQPFSDDFGTALLVRDTGSACEAQRVLFATWSGRYTANLLQTLGNPLVHNWPAGFQLAPLLLLGGTLLALRTILGELGGRALAGAVRWQTASLLLLLILAWIPAIYPTFYWFTAGVAYQLGLILLLLGLVAGQRAIRSPRPGPWAAVALALSLVTAGLSEVVVLLQAWTLLVVLTVNLKTGPPRARWVWASLLVATLAGGLLSGLAAGNTARLHTVGAPSDAWPRLWAACGPATRSAGQLLSSPDTIAALLLTTLLLIPVLMRLRTRGPDRIHLPLGWGVGALLVGVELTFLFLEAAAPGFRPGRATSFVWQWLLLGWLGVVWAALPAQVPVAAQRVVAQVQRPVALFVGLMLLGGLERNAWVEWLRNAPMFAAQTEARFAHLRQEAHRGKHRAVVAPYAGFVPRHVAIVGETLYYNPSLSFEYYLNGSVARWFGLDSVNLAAPPVLYRTPNDI